MATPLTIRIGSRGSALARAQAEAVAATLHHAHSGIGIAIIEVSTQGDRDRNTPLSKIGGIGVFVKEIETALRECRIDIAVHSLKDMPTTIAPDLLIAAVPPREDPRDALVSRDGSILDRLPSGARIGTGSSRRMAQLRALRPDIDVVSIRGNVDTRLRKVAEGEYDAAVLAMAGLARLGRTNGVAEVFPVEAMLPSPGQGALAVQVRADDAATMALVMALDDPETHRAVRAERAVLAQLGGGCLLPIGAYGHVADGELRLHAVIASLSGSPLLAEQMTADARHPEEAGADLAQRLIDRGARDLIEQAERAR